ncbi:GAF and ANTAR domain-containing protein [Candidatus Blastococcus massiliensis]|uniref:GAF and ANTAR domain-containing protein n=1 Tax=Candidatus Blastococcus massiliensis TaxID=1470358 RepID=UPI000684CDEB|nr:GAF and ANTAR domain-containing protein [Candidatus Blastococcus massiliensis]
MDDLLRDLSRVTLADRDITEVLTEITTIAARAIPGAESVSTTLLRGEKPFTAAYSSQMALDADELQYDEGYGPCMDAGRGGVVLRIDDMATEQRWPRYAPRAHARGVRSSLSVPLPYQGNSIGALNIYSGRPSAFDSEESLKAGREVAEAIAVAIVNAEAHARLSEQAQNLQLAMDSRAVIEQAKGVLIAQRRVSADEAFEILRDASQRYNRKLRDIATGIVEAAQTR